MFLAFNYGRSKKSKCSKSTAAEGNESQKSWAVVQDPEEQKTALRIPKKSIQPTMPVDTSNNRRKKSERCKNILASSERVVKTLAKRDELIVRKPAVRLVRTGDEGRCKGSIEEKETKINVDTETVHHVHTPKRNIDGSRTNRPRKRH